MAVKPFLFTEKEKILPVVQGEPAFPSSIEKENGTLFFLHASCWPTPIFAV
ncbi:hypothetical protein MJA45_27705 [Paenibacillus aurantius]|uniref:Uncharacterized protein n=1 Tax=Paenibacillus aurantius TaxID=2918900 RepID=A0AA96RHP3_9BACL|nr:hypothetical protein [Paenibacillus aurantius]WNQ11339.1 hypothetical protein MJA45_27705 [Paenibacillus aurantius]